MTKILVKDRFHEHTKKELEKDFPGEVLFEEDYEIKSPYPDVEALIIRSRSQIHSKTLKFLPKLKYIVSGTSGFDHIDFKECSKQNIKLEFCPEANKQSAAELTWALIQASARNLYQVRQDMAHLKWRTPDTPGFELKGKRIFIVGYGRIGSLVAHYAKAFGLYVSAIDPYKEIPEEVNSVSLEEGLKNCDILSLHVPKTKKTIGLIGEKEISYLKEGAIVTNTSRGTVITEDAVHKIIKEGKIKIALDVFNNEPLSEDSPLFHYKGALISPHIGAYTSEAFHKASKECLVKVKSFFEGRGLSHPVPPDEAWTNDL